MIDRRRVLLGGLAGLALPAFAQPGGGGPPGGPPGGVGQGNPAADQGRQQGRQEQRRDSPSQQPDPSRPQPPRIKALVLSQSYPSTPRLTLANTNRDAALIVRAFERLHFDQVTSHSDGSAADTLARIAAYLDTIDANTIALVYVAGHGIEVEGENLLVLEDGSSFLSLQALVQVLQQRAGVTILFLDACRTNPFEPGAAGPGRVARAFTPEAGGDVGLQTVNVGELRAGRGGRLHAFAVQGSGIKIVFSTDPANVAYDGAWPSSRNSPFATALARFIREPISLDDIVSYTTGEVIRATRRQQSPWSQGSIDRPIYLSGRLRRLQASFTER